MICKIMSEHEVNQCMIPNLLALQENAQHVLTALNPHTTGATVVALHGELGAGKTAWVQSCAQVLGVHDTIQSPTFTILKRYETRHPLWQQLVHMDAYRIEDESELAPLRLDSYLKDSHTLMCIEWAERIEGVLPEQTIHLHFEHQPMVSDTARQLTIRGLALA